MSSELLCSRLGRRCWVALRQDGRLVELHAEHPDHAVRPGRIVRGRVADVHSGLQVAFLDIGEERPGLLHARDLRLPGESLDDAAPDIAIENRLRIGHDVILQVLRTGFESKGPRLTSRIELRGRWLVFRPGAARVTTSRRISASETRGRLRRWLSARDASGGWTARTHAQQASEAMLEAEAIRLEALGRRVLAAERQGIPGVVLRESGPLESVLNELPLGAPDAIVVDDPDDRAGFLRVARSLGVDAEIGSHTGKPALADVAELMRRARRSLRSTVWLPSGASIRIEPTAALVAVDVNSSGARGGRDPESTALQVNLEAVEATARELRLRDLAGTIVVDPLDLRDERNRRALRERLDTCLGRDPAHPRVVDECDPGLIVVTRTRRGIPAVEQFGRPCGRCEVGVGVAPWLEAQEALAAHRRRDTGEVSAWWLAARPAVHRALQAEIGPEHGRLELEEVADLPEPWRLTAVGT